ncbi:phosphoribosylglycinamide formyltransferase [Helicovermis profundi]|uniref:Phosphoribosylglycinamide formyltransferase n=1 Tax=Helicovermis profundi TaxID=3065157 RepID=A0AAU9E281_9FIRM|nr:phosphoribosylglycinamide formyltransferase [Clostridia bacterium S502]
MKRIAVFISGSGTNLQQIIDNTENKNIDGKIVLVISDRKNAFGLERAENANIETLYIGKAKFIDVNERDKFIENKLKEYDVDLLVLAGFLSILPKTIINNYDKKIINIHPSLIPKYSGKGFYGDKVHKAVLENHDKLTGVTVHYVDEGIDSGQIIEQVKIEVKDDDTLDSLTQKVHKVEHKLIVKVIKEICSI